MNKISITIVLKLWCKISNSNNEYEHLLTLSDDIHRQWKLILKLGSFEVEYFKSISTELPHERIGNLITI